MSIDTDIELIDNAESGETVRGAIIRVIQDLNQNGGNAQTLNGHNSDAFTKKSEFDNFVDNEVGQIHQVLDAINKGTTLKVIDLGEHTLETSGGHIDITVPRSISDRSLLSVDDFYADIVSVAGGNGANASWTKSATYDSVQGIYHYNYGAVASEITLHFYVKRASAIAVTDYDVHHLANDITSNGEYAAPAGEAWDFVNVQVPTGSKTETTLNAVLNNHTYEQPQQSTETWNKVIVNVPGPELQAGSVSVTENNYHNTFSPDQGKDGFSSFEVDVNVPFNTQSKSVEIDAIDFSERVVPDTGWAGLSEVRITSALQLEEVTVNQNGDVTPSSDYVGLSAVHVQVPQKAIEPSKSVTYSSDGTYTVNPSSGFEAMEEVVVTVSGGGGGNCNIMDKATWDVLTFEQKKASRLTVIKNSLTDLTGAWYDLTTATSNNIPYSRNIIGDASIDNFDATSHSWGGFTLSNTLTANADGIGVDIFGRPDASQGHPDVEFVYCDLGDVNTDFTAYLVCRYSTDFAYSAIIGASYQESSGNCAYIIESGLNNVAGVCGSSSVFGSAHTANTYIVLAIRNDNKNISFFKNGVKGNDRMAYNVGRYVTLTTPYPNGTNYSTQITAAFAGVVAEAEPDSTVLENIKYLMEKFNIS